jgi:hypothetical protein
MKRAFIDYNKIEGVISECFAIAMCSIREISLPHIASSNKTEMITTLAISFHSLMHTSVAPLAKQQKPAQKAKRMARCTKPLG